MTQRLTALSLILMAAMPAASAADFGRLFFTPAERSRLDYELARNVSVDGDTGSAVVVNGIVQRRGGKRTVWINGAPQQSGRSDEANPASVPITVPGRKAPVKVKVGQKLLIDAPSAPVDQPAR